MVMAEPPLMIDHPVPTLAVAEPSSRRLLAGGCRQRYG